MFQQQGTNLRNLHAQHPTDGAVHVGDRFQKVSLRHRDIYLPQKGARFALLV